MDEQLQQKINELEAKIDAIYVSTEKTRKYFLVTMWVTVILFVMPLLGLLVIVPKAMSSYLGSISSGDIQDLQGL